MLVASLSARRTSRRNNLDKASITVKFSAATPASAPAAAGVPLRKHASTQISVATRKNRSADSSVLRTPYCSMSCRKLLKTWSFTAFHTLSQRSSKPVTSSRTAGSLGVPATAAAAVEEAVAGEAASPPPAAFCSSWAVARAFTSKSHFCSCFLRVALAGRILVTASKVPPNSYTVPMFSSRHWRMKLSASSSQNKLRPSSMCITKKLSTSGQRSSLARSSRMRIRRYTLRAVSSLLTSTAYLPNHEMKLGENTLLPPQASRMASRIAMNTSSLRGSGLLMDSNMRVKMLSEKVIADSLRAATWVRWVMVIRSLSSSRISLSGPSMLMVTSRP
mmetsp:Transcript_9350/g.16156  ORF Transcript_9350/g.16156 Transcript_9350/m.16156 type:complete len:333 (-) Transcript_9350:549-1547(-)